MLRYEGDNFVLDLQIVRGALKAYRNLRTRDFSAEAVARLPLSTVYLRFLAKAPIQPIEPDWTEASQVVCLLERRAAAMVAYRADESNIDASVDNRVSKAAIDAYLAVRVLALIQGAQSALSAHEARVVSKLFTLVRKLRHLVCQHCETTVYCTTDAARPS